MDPNNVRPALTEQDPSEDEESDISNHDHSNREELSTNMDRKSMIAGIAGCVLEWYDFACFGYFADIFAVNFFAPDEEHSLTYTFVIFGSGFLARPIGGWMIGKLGDGSFGRAKAVQLSILLMALPTFALGCLPTYDTVGNTATLLLVVIRLLQGLSVGGQLMSSTVYTMENSRMDCWGVWGATVMASSALGATIGSAVSYILRSVLTEEKMLAWGWRIPFWFGLFGAIPTFYLESNERKRNSTRNMQVSIVNEEKSDSDEQEGDIALTSSNDTSPHLDGLCSGSNTRGLISGAFVTGIPASMYYITFIWLVTYMDEIRDPPIPHAFAINTVNGLISLVQIMMGGWLIDYIAASSFFNCFGCEGLKYIMYLSTVGIAVLAPLILHAMSLPQYDDSPFAAFAFQFLLSGLLSLYQGALLPFLMMIFPQHIRLTSMALVYNIGVCLCGGFAPSVATYLTNDETSYSITDVGYCLTVISILSGIGVYLGDTKKWKEEDVSFERNDEVEMT